MNQVVRYFLLSALTVVLGLAGCAAAGAAEARGKVKSIDKDKEELVLAEGAGVNKTFHCDSKCKVTINGQESTLADLKTGDRVDLIFNKEGEATFVRGVRRFSDTFRDILEPVTDKMPDEVQRRLETEGGLIAAGVAVLVVLTFLLIMLVAFIKVISKGKKKPEPVENPAPQT